MAVKTYVDNAGLQRYNQKWHEWIEGMELTEDDIDEIFNYLYPQSLEITVNTGATSSSDKKAAIPFGLYDVDNTTLTVSWGDGTTSTLTSSDYTESDFRASVHEYSTAGTYNITVEANKWSQVYIMATNDTISLSQATAPLYYLKRTLISINNSLPSLKGIYQYSSDAWTKINDSFNGCFSRYTKLQTISSNLFENNINITNFEKCFHMCTSLTSIPANLFDRNVLAQNFKECFRQCSNLQTIPEGLFDKNTAVTNFSYCFASTKLNVVPSKLFNSTAATNFSQCFYGTNIPSISNDLFARVPNATDFSHCFTYCLYLTSIPENLFSANTEATNFSTCFYLDSAIASIPSNLFANNTKAGDFTYCFNGTGIASIPANLFATNTQAKNFYGTFQNCSNLGDFTIHIGSSLVSNGSNFVSNASGTTRKVYVPNGSLTQTTFNDVASSLGLTVMGE